MSGEDLETNRQTHKTTETRVNLSVVIPIYNEEAVLESLFKELEDALGNLDRTYEIIFVDDGSRDRSFAMLRDYYKQHKDVVRVVALRSNAGQHAAIIAGFAQSRGEYVVTMDADLQNPPQEITKLLEKLDLGHDYVGSIRNKRKDALWRDWASRAMNWIRERITKVSMTDQGCMFRGYHREIIQAVLESREAQTFIPALAYIYAANPVEVVVEHQERVAGESKYSLFKLIHLNFDLMTSFSVVPLQVFSLIGMVVSVVSLAFVILLALRRIFIGPEVEGVFTLFGIVFFMLGILLFAVGMLGEYIGRIHAQIRHRPQYLVREILEDDK